jgi:hypothetical protein
MAATPFFKFLFSKAFRRVTRILAPEAPIGCPKAQAPPLTFIFSLGIFIYLIKPIGTTAKASFTSHKSTSSVDHPILSNNFLAAGIGAVVNIPG